MITTARIAALRELNDNPEHGFGWITALRAPEIATLAAETGPLQMSLFDTQDLAEISHPDYPGERLDRLPQPRPGRRAGPQTHRTAGRHRGRRWHAIAARVAAGRLPGPPKSARPSAGSSANTRWASTFAAHDHRHQLHLSPQPGRHRRRSRPRRHLRAPHHVARRHDLDPAGGRRGLQEPGQRRTRLPQHQNRRPGPAAHPPPPQRRASAPTC